MKYDDEDDRQRPLLVCSLTWIVTIGGIAFWGFVAWLLRGCYLQ